VGNYNLLFKTDVNGNVVESNETNNVSTTAIPIVVQ
jgi:subtilase family serine protease